MNLKARWEWAGRDASKREDKTAIIGGGKNSPVQEK